MIAEIGDKALAGIISIAALVIFYFIFVIIALCKVSSQADEKERKIFNTMKRKEKEGKDGNAVPTTE